MKTRDEVVQILTTVKPELEKRYKIRRMALFGSYARGEQEEASDVDILVEVDPCIGLKFVTLANEIERTLGLPVELVSHRAISQKSMAFIEKDLIYV